MAVAFKWWPRIGIAAIGLVLVLNSTNVRAEEKESALQKKLLDLNNATTEKVQTNELRALLKDRAKAKEAVAEAVKMMKEAKDAKPFNYNGSIILAKAAHILRMYDDAEMFYKHQLDLANKVNSGKKIVNAYDGLIELYWEAKRYVDVIEKCEEVVEAKNPKEIQDFQPFALEMLIKAKAKQGKIDEALTLTKGLIVLDEDTSWYFLELRGWIQREDGKLNDAIATYKESLEKLDASKNIKDEKTKEKLKDQIHYIMSGLYVDNKEIDKAAKELEGLMKRNPDAATYRNDLGFILCDNDMKLEESEKLIKEALALDKKEKEKAKEEGKIDEVTENAAYLDSLGWVLFKQKKYKEALEPLKKAAADPDEGSHMEIWDHLADCYMALGDKKEAKSTWEKALMMEDVSSRDGERRRKVSEKLKKLKAKE